MLIFECVVEPVFRFKFADAGNLAPPLISFSEVAFSYSGKKKDYLFRDVSFGIHPASRIVLVGPNGAGFSDFVKMVSEKIIQGLCLLQKGSPLF